VTTAVTEAYVEERESLSHFRDRDIDDFFQQLLSDEGPEGLLEPRAKALGVRPEEPNTLALFRPALSTDGGAAGFLPGTRAPLDLARSAHRGAGRLQALRERLEVRNRRLWNHAG
jgi:hypothetical protein